MAVGGYLQKDRFGISSGCYQVYKVLLSWVPETQLVRHWTPEEEKDDED
jgi:hypothetical protein